MYIYIYIYFFFQCGVFKYDSQIYGKICQNRKTSFQQAFITLYH